MAGAGTAGPGREVRFPPADAARPAEAGAMHGDYEIRAIEADVVRQLRIRDDAGHVREEIHDTEGGAPLRCCLRRSVPGERLLLVSYAPLRRWAAETGAEPGAYDECGPVFIHARECGGPAGGGGRPTAMHGAHRVLRAYDEHGRILGGTLVESSGTDWSELEGPLRKLLDDERVAVVHVRAVEYGCFLMEARRSRHATAGHGDAAGRAGASDGARLDLQATGRGGGRRR